MTTTSEFVTVTSAIEQISKDAFKISKFREEIGQILRPNLWICNLSVATDEVGIQGQLETLTFRCEKAEIPGRTVATIDDTGSGPALKIPYEINYSDMEITIICSEDMNEREYFENWINKIVYPPTSDGFAKKSGLVNYYSNFAKGNKLTISQLNDKGAPSFTCILYDIYPIQISPMNLSWEETNTYQRFSVTLNYRYYRHTL